MSNTKMSDVFDLPLWVHDDQIRDEGGAFIHEGGFNFSDDPKAIVLAVNNYDNLVKALERIKDAPLGTLHRMYATDALLAIKGDQE
ncbi:MAG: hypothetical protein JKY81_04685 [Colwellia sp.]|nr:hypothetical protein [Colwellia sp.]